MAVLGPLETPAPGADKKMLAGIVGSMVVIGCVFFILPMAAGVISLIEGIMYLTKTDEEFVNTYIVNQKPWF